MKEHKIVLSDGRTGVQTTDDDGRLMEVTIGQDVFTTSRDTDCRVRIWPISYLGNVTWNVA